MTETKILLVDDQPDNTDIMMGYLNETNNSFKFMQAINGQIACKVAEKRLPDLIIMDWEMPVMNGFDALKAIKNNPLTKDIPVVMATGRSSGGDLEKALDAGAADYIRKPIEKQELVARVNTCLNISRFIKEIKSKNEKLADLNREKDGLMDVVAHDLKSPLKKLSGMLDLIELEGDLNEQQLVCKNRSKDVINNGLSLIGDLLQLHSLEHSEEPIKPTIIDLNSFIENWLDGFKPTASKKSQELKLSKPNNKIELQTDETILTRILDNLLSNAIKFTEKNKSIYVDFNKSENTIDISIQDEGPGISEEDQKQMFKLFKKLTARPTDGEHSSGLGLAIVKSLVCKLNGKITVESKMGKGTKFIVSLPI